MNWLTEIIELNNKHLVLKTEHIDWLNYFGMTEILLQHLRIASSILFHTACISRSVIFNKWFHKDKKDPHKTNP